MFEHGVVKIPNIMPDQNRSIDQRSDLVSDISKRRHVSNIFVGDTVNPTRFDGNQHGWLDQVLNVHGSSVFHGSNQRQLDDTVPARGNTGGFQIKGEDLLAMEEVVCHNIRTVSTLFEHHA